MSEPQGFVPDDLQLAKSAGKKLVYLVSGLFSGGLGGLAVQCTIDHVLPVYYKRICAFIEVIRATETTFGSKSKESFAWHVDQLDNQFQKYYACFVRLNEQRRGKLNIIETNVNELLIAYVDLLELEAKFMKYVGLQAEEVNRHQAEAKAIVSGYLSNIG